MHLYSGTLDHSVRKNYFLFLYIIPCGNKWFWVPKGKRNCVATMCILSIITFISKSKICVYVCMWACVQWKKIYICIFPYIYIYVHIDIKYQEKILCDNIWAWTSLVVICLQKNTTDWVAYKEEKCISHSSRSPRSRCWQIQYLLVAHFLIKVCLLTVISQGRSESQFLGSVLWRHWAHSWRFSSQDVITSQRPHPLYYHHFGSERSFNIRMWDS